MQLLRLAKMEDPAKRKIELEALHQVQRSEPDGFVLLWATLCLCMCCYYHVCVCAWQAWGEIEAGLEHEIAEADTNARLFIELSEEVSQEFWHVMRSPEKTNKGQKELHKHNVKNDPKGRVWGSDRLVELYQIIKGAKIDRDEHHNESLRDNLEGRVAGVMSCNETVKGAQDLAKSCIAEIAALQQAISQLGAGQGMIQTTLERHVAKSEGTG